MILDVLIVNFSLMQGKITDPRATQLTTLRIPPISEALTYYEPEFAYGSGSNAHFGIVFSSAAQANLATVLTRGKDVEDSYMMFRPPVLRNIPGNITGA